MEEEHAAHAIAGACSDGADRGLLAEPDRRDEPAASMASSMQVDAERCQRACSHSKSSMRRSAGRKLVRLPLLHRPRALHRPPLTPACCLLLAAVLLLSARLILASTRSSESTPAMVAD